MYSVRTVGVRLAIAACLVACGSTTSLQRVRTPEAQTLEARKQYIAGMEELLAGNYSEAIEIFNQVSRQPGYVKYSALARLRVGDAILLKEQYEAAIVMYEGFLKQFEGHPESGYASFRIAQAYYAQIPSEWFLAPPVYERQQVHLNYATKSLKRFIDLYPGHRLLPQAQRMLNGCLRIAFEHELYVADYYDSREKPHGVVQRLEHMFKAFPVRSVTERTVLMLARAYAQTKQVKKAIFMYQAYLERFRAGSQKEAVKRHLRDLRSEQSRSDENKESTKGS
jgi:outer membrane protein assembly factor BamD